MYCVFSLSIPQAISFFLADFLGRGPRLAYIHPAINKTNLDFNLKPTVMIALAKYILYLVIVLLSVLF